MNFDGMNRRLSGIEKRRGARDCILSFPGGTQRAIHVRNALSLLLTSFSQRAAETKGEHPEPSEYDLPLTLFRNAESVQGDALFELVLDNERQRKEERQ